MDRPKEKLTADKAVEDLLRDVHEEKSDLQKLFEEIDSMPLKCSSYLMTESDAKSLLEWASKRNGK
jgi:hypothetical protein